MLPTASCSPHSARFQGTAHAEALAAVPATLHKGSLLLERGERLLQALDLGLPAGLALLVSLWLRDAAVLDLLVVLEHGRQLRVCALAICGDLGDGGVQTLELLRL